MVTSSLLRPNANFYILWQLSFANCKPLEYYSCHFLLTENTSIYEIMSGQWQSSEDNVICYHKVVYIQFLSNNRVTPAVDIVREGAPHFLCLHSHTKVTWWIYRTYFCSCLLLSRSRWPRGLGRGSEASRLLGLPVRIPPVSCVGW